MLTRTYTLLVHLYYRLIRGMDGNRHQQTSSALLPLGLLRERGVSDKNVDAG